MLILNNFNYNDRHIHGSDTMIGGHMPPRTKEGSLALAYSIKQRRHELGLSAEEAARKAGVGTKTWFRYESGNSIRNDKIKGVCKALSWTSLPQPGVDAPSIAMTMLGSIQLMPLTRHGLRSSPRNSAAKQPSPSPWEATSF